MKSKNLDYKEVPINTRIRKELAPKQVDSIIIGAGISGLISGAIISKLGKKCLVLEMHDRAGGLLHTFTEQGYEFDTGFHYVLLYGNI